MLGLAALRAYLMRMETAVAALAVVKVLAVVKALAAESELGLMLHLL